MFCFQSLFYFTFHVFLLFLLQINKPQTFGFPLSFFLQTKVIIGLYHLRAFSYHLHHHCI